MKKLVPFLLFTLFVLLGCDYKPISDTKQNENMKSIDVEISNIASDIAELEQKIPSSYNIQNARTPTMLHDILKIKTGIANLKASKANLESSQKLIQSIEQFDRSSTKLSTWMLRLTCFTAILTVIILCLTYVQAILTFILLVLTVIISRLTYVAQKTEVKLLRKLNV